MQRRQWQFARGDGSGRRTGEQSMFSLSGVKLGQGALRDPLQHLFGEDPHELPADVQGLKDASVLIRA